METEKRGYYVYFDSIHEKYFYYDAFNGTTSWRFPKDGVVLDPKTRKRFFNPKLEKSASTGEFTRSLELQKSVDFIVVEPSVQNFVQPNAKQEKEPSVEKKIEMCRMESVHMDIKKSFTEEIHHFIFADFAKEYFKKQKKRIVFKRTQVSLDSLISFQSKPIDSPLLSSLPERYTKDAIKCFNLILSYTGANGKKVPHSATLIVGMLYVEEPLIDEVYFQIIKQTQHNPRPDCLIDTFNLFLIIATIFPSTLNSETWIKSFLSQKMDDPDLAVSTLAKFIYIRFQTRCLIGKAYTGLLEHQITVIPLQIYASHQAFGVTLSEVMWNQRKFSKDFPIPLILYRLIQILIDDDCFNYLGIFRLSGNLKEVELSAERINKGDEDVLKNRKIDDIASLLKLWLRDLVDPLIPYHKLDELLNCPESQYIIFVNSLPKVNRLTLAYLIGFLQELVKHESETKMSDNNLAIVFGPNIVQTKETLINGQRCMEVGRSFVLTLIHQWDVSSIYPIDATLYHIDMPF